MSPKTIRGFAVVYALLFLVVIGSALGAYTTYNMHGVKRDVATVKASLGDQNLTRLADKAIADAAQAQGFAVVKIVVLRTVVHGDDARVTARVTVTDGVAEQTVTLVAKFTRGVWNSTGMATA